MPFISGVKLCIPDNTTLRCIRGSPWPIHSRIDHSLHLLTRLKALIESLQLNSVFRLAAVGPVPCHSTVTVSPVTVIPSLIRCREHIICSVK